MKRVLPDGLAHQDGRIKRGDRIISINGKSLSGLDNKSALLCLKNSGATVTLEVARRVGRRGSRAPTPFGSHLHSCHSSGEITKEPPSPVPEGRHVPVIKRQDSSGSEGGLQTPPTFTVPVIPTRRRSRRESSSGLMVAEDDFSAGREKVSTMPRKLNSTVGIKIMELFKGPTGLGMQIRGGTDTNLPIMVNVVFPGGPAHKSGKINPGDVIIEANNESFENLTHKEAIERLKGFPQGKVSLLVRDRTATTSRANL